MPHGRVTSAHMIRMLFMMCILAYVAAYLGRLDYAACLVEIIQTEGWLKSDAGLIATGFFITYGLGQLVNGFIGDRVSPKYMVACGLGLSGVVNLMFPLMNSIPAATALWCVNGFVQSMLWSPLIRLLSEWMPEKRRIKSVVNMNAAIPIGTLAAYGLSAALVYLGNWKNMFYLSGIILMLVSVIWIINIGRIEQNLQPAQDIISTEEVKEVQQGSFWKIAILSALPICCLAIFTQGMLKDGITLWIPTFLSESFNLVSAAAILSTTVVPIVNLGGVYFASWINGRFLHNELLTGVALFSISLCSLSLLTVFSDNSAIVSLIMLAITTTCMMGINTLFSCMIPSYFIRFGVCSTVTGILDAAAYVGCAISSYATGAIVEVNGWNSIMPIWCVIAIVGIIVCAIATVRWGKFRKITDSAAVDIAPQEN